MKATHITKVFLLSIPLLCTGISCTDLDVKVHDQVTDFWRTDAEITAGIAPAYSNLRLLIDPYSVYGLNELSTDEIIVPIRNTEWVNGGIWEEMWKHTWRPDHYLVQTAWADIYKSIGTINRILDAVALIDPAPKDLAGFEAELKTVRAYCYFLALDLFGNVPIVESNSTSQPVQKTKSEVFAYIENELKDNLAALTTDVTPLTYGRATRWLAQTLLAKLYLNSEVYTGIARWSDCIIACSAILDANKYSLESDFFSNFKIKNEFSRENIFVIPFDRVAGLGDYYLQFFTLHYHSNETFGLQWAFPPRNGFCSTAEYYALFDANDVRRKMFLVGQQYKDQIESPANLQYDRSGNLLIFDPVITTFVIQPPKTETAGARCVKWEINKESLLMSNDFVVFRLADIILMKAEAQFRNGDAAGALTTVNQKINGVSIRSRAGLSDFSANEMNLDGLLRERARELSWEGHRRNDLIRFGHFTDARIPEKAVSESFRILFPIPRSVMENNGLLIQNPGYVGG